MATDESATKLPLDNMMVHLPMKELCSSKWLGFLWSETVLGWQ